MRGVQKVAVLAMAVVLGCGGGGGDDGDEGEGGDGGGNPLRTTIACMDARGTGCATVSSDAPTELSCGNGAREVGSCSEDGVRATCSTTVFAWRGVLRVYSSDPAVLAQYQEECEGENGAWWVAATP